MRMSEPVKTVLISGCLLGLECNYKAKASNAWHERLRFFVEKAISVGLAFVPVCPEQLGGLPTPRIPAELQGSAKEIFAGQGKVLNQSGDDVTSCFVKGARESLKMAKLFSASLAVLKSKSPSCGCNGVYDGSFSGKLVSGEGLTALLLRQNGVRVIDENEFVFLCGQESGLKKL